MKNKLKIIIPICIAIIAIALAFVFIRFTPSQKADIKAIISTAQQYIIEQNYEAAIVQFKKALQIDPRNVEAYIGIAQAYEAIGDTESALEWLHKGYDLTGDSTLKAENDRISDLAEDVVTAAEESAVTTATTIAETTITTEITAEEKEEEIIRAQALEILAPFVPNKQTGEPNSILFAYYGVNYGSNEALEYMCFKCEYDNNGNLYRENEVKVDNLMNRFSELSDRILLGNIISYSPYSSKMFERLNNGNFAVCEDNGAWSTGLDGWYNNILYHECTKKSDNEYEFDAGYNLYTVYLENNEIYKIENSYSGYTESLSYNFESNAWEYINNNVTPYIIGLPDGCDESIFELDDNKIEKTFTDYNEFMNYTNSN